METLMIIILLAFTPVKGTDKVGVEYEAKLGITTMEKCKQVEKVLAEDPPKGKSAIVICVQSKEPAKAPAKVGGRSGEV